MKVPWHTCVTASAAGAADKLAGCTLCCGLDLRSYGSNQVPSDRLRAGGGGSQVCLTRDVRTDDRTRSKCRFCSGGVSVVSIVNVATS
jgi:hypothetical protein